MNDVSALRPSAFVPTACAVLVLLTGCTVSAASTPEPEPERFKRHVMAVESSVGQARAGIVEDTLTGCLYSFTYADGVSPITLPSGAQAGCKATTASARGYEAAEQRSAPNPPQSAGE